MYWSFCLLFLCLFQTQVSGFSKDPDIDRNIPEIIEARGFKAETHHVQTKDGYILGVYRIVNPFYKGKVKRPVLMTHGKFSSAVDFIINSKDEILDSKEHGKDACEVKLPVKGSGNNIGFECAKRGLDVWLLNMRGNKYSLNHTTLSPKEKKFWRFSSRDVVLFDLPAVIDYILKNTQQKKVAYVGHSQGTTVMFSLLAEMPKYSNLVSPVVLLSPVASLINFKQPAKYLAYIPGVHQILLKVGGPLFIPPSLTHKAAKALCSVHLRKSICEYLPALLGFKGLNPKRVPVYLAHANAGGSNWNLAHSVKVIRWKILRKFDYGSKRKNLEAYGVAIPPKIPLWNITSKELNLIRAPNDPYVSEEAMKYLKDTLTVNFKLDHVIPDEEFQHLDYLYHKNAGLLVNDHVLNILLGSLNCHKGADIGG